MATARRRCRVASIFFYLHALLLLTLATSAADVDPTTTTASPSHQRECKRDGNTYAGGEDEDGCGDSGIVDYLIVGAGGGGIQTALLMKRHGRSCLVLERERSTGSFWTRHPRFDELISVNKRTTDPDRRYRYDWHSFLGTPLTMWDHISKEYFPSGRDFHRYMNLVAKREGIDVRFGVDVASFESKSDGTPCVVLRQDGSRICARRRVFVGTGLRERDERYLRAIGGVPYSRMRREYAAGRRVCVLGNGNAAFEVAQNTFDVADRVFVMGKHPVRVSAVTKYTGDVRVKFLQLLENFHGKLLDAVYEPDHGLEGYGIGKGMNATQIEELYRVVNAMITVNMHGCELLVIATGFRSCAPGFDPEGSDRRFPPMEEWYAAPNNPRVHYVGWLMHAYDFRRGAGGFLSGYRYLIRNLVHHVREMDDAVPYPHHIFVTKEDAANHAVERFKLADDLVILQDGVVLRDAIVRRGRNENIQRGMEYHYYEGITYAFHKDLERDGEAAVTMYLSWGEGRDTASVFENIYQYNDTKQLRNSKLHPVVEVNGLVREALEDIDMEFSIGMFTHPIKQMVRDALAGDYSKFYPKPDYAYKPTVYDQPRDRREPEAGLDDEGAVYLTGLRKAVEYAILLGGTKESLERVRLEARSGVATLVQPAEDPSPRSHGARECASPGRACNSDGSLDCCQGDGTICSHVPGAKASFCVVID